MFWFFFITSDKLAAEFGAEVIQKFDSNLVIYLGKYIYHILYYDTLIISPHLITL